MENPSQYVIELNATPTRLHFIADRILEAFPIEQQGPITIVIHDKATSLDDIASVYREMIANLVTRPFGRVHSTVVCTGSRKVSAFNDRYTNRIESLLVESLGKGDLERAKTIIMDTAGLKKCSSQKWSLFEVTQFTTGALNTIADFDKNSDNLAYEEVQDAINYGLRSLNKDIIISNMELALCIAEGESAGENTSISSQVENVRDYIENHYMEHLSLSGLAEQFFVEPSYLSRKFSQKYNETITTYITRCRMDRAKKLMEDEKNKLEAISFEVGYDDYNYFSRVFRRLEGISPSEYRKNHIE